MNEISFKVQGSASDPYEVQFIKRSTENLSAYCSCPAGEKGQYCKHRFSILDGSDPGIVSGNTDQVSVVQSWLAGTDVEKSMKKVSLIENEMSEIKKRLTAAKKEVARAMHD